MELTNSSALPVAASEVSPLLSMTDIYQSIQDIRKVTDSYADDIKSIKSAVNDSPKNHASFSPDSKASKTYGKNPNFQNNNSQSRSVSGRNQSFRGSQRPNFNPGANNGNSSFKQSNSFSTPIICTYCGKNGHTSAMCLKKATDQGYQLALRGSWTPRRPGRSFYRGNQGFQSPRPFSSRS